MGWASFGQGELVKGRVMFPRRKVAVWAYREGFLDEVRLESYWMAGWKRSLAWVREEKGLGPPWAESALPQRGSLKTLSKQTSRDRTTWALCVWRKGLLGILPTLALKKKKSFILC